MLLKMLLDDNAVLFFILVYVMRSAMMIAM